MPRVKRGTKRRNSRKRHLPSPKGFSSLKSKLYRSAQEAVVRSRCATVTRGGASKSAISARCGSCASERRAGRRRFPTASSWDGLKKAGGGA